MSDTDETPSEWAVRQLKVAAVIATQVGRKGYSLLGEAKDVTTGAVKALISHEPDNIVYYPEEIDRDRTFSVFRYKRKFCFDYRRDEANRVLHKYPDRVPCIVQRGPNSRLDILDQEKFLAPKDLTVGQFLYSVRRRVRLNAEQALFIFINNKIPPTAMLMGQIWKENQEDDGFVYVTYQEESTFG